MENVCVYVVYVMLMAVKVARRWRMVTEALVCVKAFSIFESFSRFLQ